VCFHKTIQQIRLQTSTFRTQTHYCEYERTTKCKRREKANSVRFLFSWEYKHAIQLLDLLLTYDYIQWTYSWGRERKTWYTNYSGTKRNIFFRLWCGCEIYSPFPKKKCRLKKSLFRLAGFHKYGYARHATGGCHAIWRASTTRHTNFWGGSDTNFNYRRVWNDA
jgi:hypothetical protein